VRRISGRNSFDLDKLLRVLDSPQHLIPCFQVNKLIGEFSFINPVHTEIFYEYDGHRLENLLEQLNLSCIFGTHQQHLFAVLYSLDEALPLENPPFEGIRIYTLLLCKLIEVGFPIGSKAEATKGLSVVLYYVLDLLVILFLLNFFFLLVIKLGRGILAYSKISFHSCWLTRCLSLWAGPILRWIIGLGDLVFKKRHLSNFSESKY